MATRRLIYVSAILAGVGLGLAHTAVVIDDWPLAKIGGGLFVAGFVASLFLVKRR